MSLQTILSICEQVGIDDQRFVGQQISRNQRITTSEIVTVVPFGFTMKPHDYLLYSQNRTVLNNLRIADKAIEQYLNFTTTGWVNYIAYQGQMTTVEINNSTFEPASANKTLVLTPGAGVPSTSYVVRAGDFCQVGRYAYIATADVLRGVNPTVNIPVHRNLITPVVGSIPAVLGQYGTTIALGGQTYVGVTFPVILREYPTYTLIPMTNDSFIKWNSTFQAFESVL